MFAKIFIDNAFLCQTLDNIDIPLYSLNYKSVEIVA